MVIRARRRWLRFSAADDVIQTRVTIIRTVIGPVIRTQHHAAAGNGQAVFTHAVNFGAAQTRYRNMQQATSDFINTLQQGSSNLRSTGGYQRVDVNGRNGLLLTLNNVNEATGQRETINVVTTQ